VLLKVLHICVFDLLNGKEKIVYYFIKNITANIIEASNCTRVLEVPVVPEVYFKILFY
jgi:hypothetical protein